MRKPSFHKFIRNKLLLLGVTASILLALGTMALIHLNGSAHSPSTEVADSSPQALDLPSEILPTQNSSQDSPDTPIEGTDPSAETQTAEKANPNTPFPIIDETACIPDNTEVQIASVLDALDPDRLSVLLEGETYTVKFLGIDTDVVGEKVREEVLAANEMLIGDSVALVADCLDNDADGDLLRYVFTENAFVNLALLERGLAIVSNAHLEMACGELFKEAQDTAKLQELGTWARLKPEDWHDWPVIPTIRENAIEIYLRGLEAGTNPRLFSIVGDCQNIPGGSLFKKVNWEDFSLPQELEYLQPTLENFRTIWSREPITVDGGFIPASMFSTYWTDTERCDPTETPLECEFRLNNASILIISIGSDQKPGTSDDFDRYMRKIVEYSIENNVLPIIATDAYPTEEGFPLNYIMATIAYDYDIPLWNFWAAVQDLPNHGLKDDNFHISAEAFAIKRITGIQVLHAVLTAAQ